MRYRNGGICSALLLVMVAQLPAQTPRIRDSAGVQIVENDSRAKAPVVFKTGATPTTDIGGLKQNLDEELKNSLLVGGVRLSDGRVVVTAFTHLKMFDARGKLLKLIGREGSGPGEFRSVAGSICRGRGDTVVVRDGNNARMSVIDPTGKVVGSFTYKGGLLPGFCFTDGTVLQASGSPRKVDLDSVLIPLIAVRSDGTPAHDFGAQPYLNLLVRPASWVAGEHLIIGDAKTSELRLFNMAGKLTRIIRTNDPPVEARSNDPVRGGIRAAGSTVNIAEPKPSGWNYPAYGAVMVDPTGRIFMEDDHFHVAAPGWTVFDRTGRMLGRFALPPSLGQSWRVMGFGVNEVIISRLDDDGARHLTFYPIVPVP